MNSFMGVMIGYFANMAIPRMGEFTRCGVVSKYENVPFSKLLGTVVTERVFDMIMLLLLTLVVVVSQFKQVGIFLNNNEEIKQKLYTMFHSPWTYVVLGVLIVGVAGFFWFVRKGTFFPVTSFLSGNERRFIDREGRET
ncbi:MAG: lysylphosphatidylglycerol synthase transmembrane domain-containing protein [Butyricimonas paravirosa]